MKKGIVLLLPWMLAACSAQTKFVPVGQDLAQTAHLIAADSDIPGVFVNKQAHYMVFDSVDGKPIHGRWDVRVSSNELYLMPGAHVFEVEFLHGGAHAVGTFSIQARAGKTYFIHHEVSGYRVRMWVTDGPDGALAATPVPKG